MLVPISNNIFFVSAPNRARFPYSHSLLISDESKILIDTSCGEENINFLNNKGIDIIVNSHFHEDHILNNNCFTSAEIWAHADDAPAIICLETFADYYGFTGDNVQLGQDFIQAIGLQASPVHRELKADEILDFGQVKLQVIHTPGHTPGHCCFYEEKNGLLFLGDIDLSSFGPWYAHSCSNIGDFINSIEKCISLNPAIVVSSHKGLFRNNIKELLTKYLDKIYITQDRIIDTLSKPYTLEEITNLQIFYGNKIILDPLYRAMESMAIKLHLERLLELGQIARDGDYYYLSN